MSRALYCQPIQHRLEQGLYGGRTLTDFKIDSSEGVQTIDLVWLSDDQWRLFAGIEVAPFAPRICIEFNPETATLNERAQLLLNQFAEEVWFCDAQGQLSFYNQNGQLSQSRMAPRFQSNMLLPENHS